MRRMLDPKEVEGLGGGGAPRHVYTITINGTLNYTAYTEKDYNLPIGKKTNISDFETNTDYQELKKIKTYPTTGYVGLSNGKNFLTFLFEYYSSSSNIYRVAGTYTVDSGIKLEFQYFTPQSFAITQLI